MTRRVLEVLGRSEGGIARHVGQVVEGLSGRDGLVVDAVGPRDLPVELPGRVGEIDIPNGPSPAHLTAIARIWRMLHTQHYDIVHGHGLRAGIDSGIAGKGRTRRFATMHNLIHAEISGRALAPVYRRMEPVAVRVNDVMFAPSEAIAHHLRSSVGERFRARIRVLPLGVDESPEVARDRTQILSELGFPQQTRLIVTAARLAPQKDLSTMLRAVALLPGDVRLAVVGDGPLRADLEAEARTLGVHARVRFTGFRRDVADYIAAADVFCLSSVWEAVSLSVKEAIVLGVPVVSTDAGGMRELVADRETGRMVAVGDSTALAEALADVLASETDQRTYALNARRALEERFSTAAMLERLRAVYLEAS